MKQNILQMKATEVSSQEATGRTARLLPFPSGKSTQQRGSAVEKSILEGKDGVTGDALVRAAQPPSDRVSQADAVKLRSSGDAGSQA